MKSSMPSKNWQVLGTGEVLGHLRPDLKRAKSVVWLVGPWIDGFFAEAIIGSLTPSVELKVITRPPSGADSGFREHALAARSHFDSREQTSIRLLERLHAKVVVIDEALAFCGSANWYRYSLEESGEIVVRGPVADMTGILEQVQILWDEAVPAEPVEERHQPTPAVAGGCREEVLDPIAAAKLKEVPGSFVLGRKPPRRR